MSEVTWYPHPVYTLHELTPDGRVRTIGRWAHYKDGRKPRWFPSRELSQWTSSRYPTVNLSGYTDDVNQCLHKRVHVLVCETFHGLKTDPKLEVRHLNGNPKDNRAENLAWGTKAENIQDIFRHGRNSNTNKKTCPRGHSYDLISVVKGRRQRRCSICDKENKRAWEREARRDRQGTSRTAAAKAAVAAERAS